MFKVNLNLPSQVVKQTNKKQKKKPESNGTNLKDDSLENMMKELKKDVKIKPNAEIISKYPSLDKVPVLKKQEKEYINIDVPSEASKVGKNSVERKSKITHDSKSTKRQTTNEDEVLKVPPKKRQLTPLQLKMQQKLSGSRFRWINEQLYTTKSKSAFIIFQTQPEVFKEYHDGFRHQVESWPENPVLNFTDQFKERLAKPINAPGGLPGDKSQNQPAKVIVADMGCGEAELSLRLQELNCNKYEFKIHSFDLHAGNDRITVADIANVPLPNESCHVVVFCLALMCTNLVDFINEGIRILKPNGLVWIAEIKSRFENGEYQTFVDTLKDMGLYHKTTDASNQMFVKFEFVKLSHKLAKAKNRSPDLQLKPCIYKRR